MPTRMRGPMVSGQEHPLLAEGGALLAGAVTSAIIGPMIPPRYGPGPGPPPPPPRRPGGPPPDRWGGGGPGGPPGRFDDELGDGIRRFCSTLKRSRFNHRLLGKGHSNHANKNERTNGKRRGTSTSCRRRHAACGRSDKRIDRTPAAGICSASASAERGKAARTERGKTARTKRRKTARTERRKAARKPWRRTRWAAR